MRVRLLFRRQYSFLPVVTNLHYIAVFHAKSMQHRLISLQEITDIISPDSPTVTQLGRYSGTCSQGRRRPAYSFEILLVRRNRVRTGWNLTSPAVTVRRRSDPRLTYRQLQVSSSAGSGRTLGEHYPLDMGTMCSVRLATSFQAPSIDIRTTYSFFLPQGDRHRAKDRLVPAMLHRHRDTRPLRTGLPPKLKCMISSDMLCLWRRTLLLARLDISLRYLW